MIIYQRKCYPKWNYFIKQKITKKKILIFLQMNSCDGRRGIDSIGYVF